MDRIVGEGRTYEEAKADYDAKVADARIDEAKEKATTAFVVLAFFALAVIGKTVIEVLLRPIPGTLVLIALYFFAMLIGVPPDLNFGAEPTLTATFQLVAIFVVLLVLCVSIRGLLIKFEHAEGRYLDRLYAVNPMAARLLNGAAYLYSLLFMPIVIGICQGGIYRTEGSAPINGVLVPLQLLLDIFLLVVGLMVVFIRYYQHPYGKAHSLTGLPRDSWLIPPSQDRTILLVFILTAIFVIYQTNKDEIQQDIVQTAKDAAYTSSHTPPRQHFRADYVADKASADALMKSMIGTWKGTFSCGGQTNATVLVFTEIDANDVLEGTRQNSALPGHNYPEFSYHVNASFDQASHTVEVKPGAWIVRPNNAPTPLPFTASVSEDGQRFTGRFLNSGCATIDAKKVN